MSVETEKDGGLREVSTARFLEREINGALDESMFEFEFPEGTTVDKVDGSNQTLIVTQDKQLVPISDMTLLEFAGRLRRLSGERPLPI